MDISHINGNKSNGWSSDYTLCGKSWRDLTKISNCYNVTNFFKTDNGYYDHYLKDIQSISANKKWCDACLVEIVKLFMIDHNLF